MISKKRFFTGTLAVVLLGSAFHFLYDALGQSALAAPFFAVNESVWEHMKLLAMAAFLWMIVDFFWADRSVRIRFCAPRAVGLLVGLITIPMLYYFMKGAFGVDSLVVDIGIFVIAAALFEAISLKGEQTVQCVHSNIGGSILLTAIFIVFVVFTFFPPHAPLFLDTPTGTYGIPR